MWQRVGDHHRRRRRDVGSALKGVWIFLGERGRGGLHSLSPCAQPGISKRLPAEGDGRVVFCLAEEGGGLLVLRAGRVVVCIIIIEMLGVL